jgi:hypothetical protein
VRNARKMTPNESGASPPTNPIVGSFAGCCARVASGQPAAEHRD